MALFDALPPAAAGSAGVPLLLLPPAQLSTLLGSMPDARFGWQLLLADVTGDGAEVRLDGWADGWTGEGVGPSHVACVGGEAGWARRGRGRHA